MSCCLVVQKGDEFVVGVDGAVVNESNHRVFDFYQKFFVFPNFCIFCSGKLFFVENLINSIKTENVSKIKGLEKLLESYPLTCEHGKPIEILAFHKGEMYSITAESNYKLKKIEKRYDCLQFFSCGLKTEESNNALLKNLSNKKSITEAIESTFKDIECEEIGGKISIFYIENENCKLLKSYYDKKDLSLIAGDSLIGNMFFGNQLAIQNDGGTISLDSDGFNTTTLDGLKNIRINPNDGIKIRKRTSTTSTWNDQMYFDSSGNLTMQGTLKSISPSVANSFMEIKDYIFRMVKQNNKIMEISEYFNQPKIEYFDENNNPTFSLENVQAGFQHETKTSPYLIAGLKSDKVYRDKISVISSEINLSDSLLIADATVRDLNVNIGRSLNDVDGNGLSLQLNYGRRIDINYKNYDPSSRGRVYFRRTNLGILGDLDVSGTKPASIPTQHYGVRTLYCTEADRAYFTTDGNAEITNGECIIYLDPIFIETIELNSNYPYIVSSTPYGNSIVWVDEIHDSYVVFKSEKDIKFSYSIKAVRIAFGGEYLEENLYYSKKDLEEVQRQNIERMSKHQN